MTPYAGLLPACPRVLTLLSLDAYISLSMVVHGVLTWLWNPAGQGHMGTASDVNPQQLAELAASW